MLDHLRVVVGREERLALAARGHRQHADEVGQPGVGSGLELRVLVQEVVDLPGLVGDPEVETLLGHDIVEDHEVRAEDLVEPAQHLEGVELVLARLGVDVRGLGGELGAGRVDASRRTPRAASSPAAGRATRPRDPGCSCRSSRAIATSRQAWPRPIGEETSSARRPPRPARARRAAARAGRRASANSWISRLTITGLARHREVAGALEEHVLGPGQLGEREAPRRTAGSCRGRRGRRPPGSARAGTGASTSSFAEATSSTSSITSASTGPSSPKATASSICLVECGSGNISPKKNSRNPRVVARAWSGGSLLPALRIAAAPNRMSRARRLATDAAPSAAGRRVRARRCPSTRCGCCGGDLSDGHTPSLQMPTRIARLGARGVHHGQAVGCHPAVCQRCVVSGTPEWPLPRPS